MDPDQLGLSEASRSGSTLFTRELISTWFHTVIESVNCLSTERYKLLNLYYMTSKIFFGQVHYGHLLVPGQVENFTISTPLVIGTVP